MVYKLVADFETLTHYTHMYNSKTIKLDNFYLKYENKNTRVWASCLYDIDSDKVVHLSNNIIDFVEVLKINSKKSKLEVYFHNLKFDSAFLLDYLYTIGFTYNDLLDKPNTFRTIITDTGLVYQLELRFYTKSKCKVVTIRDSLKIIPLKVSQMAKAFGLKTLKGDIDYKLHRHINHNLTSEETEYIINDCRIVAQSLQSMFNLGLNKMTIASNALSSYKDSLGGQQKFRNYFPLLSTVDDNFIRQSYKGGYTYVNPNIQHKNINKNGMTFDVNSLYPSVMYGVNGELLPYDMPLYFQGEYKQNRTHPLFIQRLKCKFKLNKGYVPIIQLKNSRFCPHEYLTNSGVERVELTLTSVDLELIKEHYTLTNVEYLDGYMFKAKKDLFKSYIDYWISVKIQAEQDGNKGLRQIAKLMLNSLYGKFASNGVSDVKIPILKKGIIHHQAKVNIGEVEFNGVLKDDKDRELNYTAMACFITAYSRKITITAIQDVGGLKKNSRFCYADTDSIHIVGEEIPSNIWVDKTSLGAWKYESNWSYAKFLRAKTYIEEIEGGLEVKCAGMPDNTKQLVTKKNFKVGFKVLADDKTIDDKFKKLMPKFLKGGIVLIESDFTIK